MIEHLAISELIQSIDEFITETAGKTIRYDHYRSVVQIHLAKTIIHYCSENACTQAYTIHYETAFNLVDEAPL